MKLKNIYFSTCLSGHFKVKIRYYGKDYSCVSTNTLAYDRISSGCYLPGRASFYGYTYKQAVDSLFEECLRQNCLGKYKYSRI